MDMSEKITRCCNDDAGRMAGKQITFTTRHGSLFGKWVTPWLYVVYSYGDHWPLYVYEKVGRSWLENGSKTPSRTTTRHRSQAQPRAYREGTGFIYLDTATHTCEFLLELIHDHKRAAREHRESQYA